MAEHGTTEQRGLKALRNPSSRHVRLENPKWGQECRWRRERIEARQRDWAASGGASAGGHKMHKPGSWKG
jgi:hypothetical protein